MTVAQTWGQRKMQQGEKWEGLSLCMLLFQIQLLLTICLFFSFQFLIVVKYTQRKICHLLYLEVHSSGVLHAFVILCSCHHSLSPRLFSSCSTDCQEICVEGANKMTSIIVRILLYRKEFDTVAFQSFPKNSVLREGCRRC